MQAGELRHRVTIQSKVVTQNTYGEEELAWSDVATGWAAVEPLAGREYLEAKQVQADVTTRIRMRYRGSIRPEMRAVWGSHIYDILEVIQPDGRPIALHLMCREML